MSNSPGGQNYNANIQMEHQPERDKLNDRAHDDKPTTRKKMKQQSNGSEKSPFLLPEATNINVDNPDEETDLNEYWTDEEDNEDQNEEVITKMGAMTRVVTGFQRSIQSTYKSLMDLTKGYLFKSIFFIGFMVYFGLAMNYRFGDEGSIRLLACTALGLFIIAWRIIAPLSKWLFKRLYGDNKLNPSHGAIVGKIMIGIRWLLYGLLAAVIVWTLVEEGRSKPENLRSLPGLALFIIIPALFSAHPGKINWHTIYWAVGLQFLFALAVLKLEKGQDVIIWIQERLDEFFACTASGSKLLFGDTYKDHQMIFGALPIVFFTNATVTMLYYLGVVQFVVNVIGSILNFILGTSPAESTAVAAGIFLEGISAILALRNYLPSLSKSQLFVVVTSAFASLGGAYLAILSSIGISLKYLIPAMVVSAPATFAVCKVMVPETKWTKEKDGGRQTDKSNEKSQYRSAMDAAHAGAFGMMALVGNIAITAFVFISYIDWINKTLTWFGDRVGIEKLSIELISSYLLYPVALMMGIEPDDCRNVAMLLGFRVGINNIIAFIKLRHLQENRKAFNYYMQVTNFTGPVSYTRDDIRLDLLNVTLDGGIISDRSEAIVTYSLCGFSSFMSVAITMGVMTMLVPNRKLWMSKMTIPALIAGNIANCMTGCFASIFYN